MDIILQDPCSVNRKLIIYRKAVVFIGCAVQDFCRGLNDEFQKKTKEVTS